MRPIGFRWKTGFGQGILVIFFLLYLESAHALPYQKQVSASDLTHGPGVAFLSDQERRDLVRALQEGDFVFVAEIESIYLMPATMTGISVYMTRVSFEDMRMLKGEKLERSTFDYFRPKKAPEFYRGMDVLVILKKTGWSKKSISITSIIRADKKTLAVADKVLR